MSPFSRPLTLFVLIALTGFAGDEAVAARCPAISTLLKRTFAAPERVSPPARAGSTARSSWSKSEVVRQSNAPYSWLQMEHSLPIIDTHAGSFASKDPRLTEVLDDINLYCMDQRNFERQYELHHGKAARIGDIRKFYLNRVELFRDGIFEFVHQLQRQDAGLAGRIGSKTHLELKALSAGFERVCGLRGVHYDDVLEAAGQLNKRLKSILSELHAAVSLPHATQVGLPLAQHARLNEALTQRIATLKKISHSDAAWQKLVEDYPRIFGNGLLSQRNSSRNGLIDNIAAWIRDKEIDVIRSVDGQERWLEIKLRSSPLAWDEFKNGSVNSKKPLLQQAEENLEILRFLGLDKEVKIEYLITTKVDAQVVSELRNRGITVIHSSQERIDAGAWRLQQQQDR